jgi:hypothetical protein
MMQAKRAADNKVEPKQIGEIEGEDISGFDDPS